MIDASELFALPLRDRSDAEAYIRTLHRMGLGFHFDDGAVDCLYGNGRVTLAHATRIDDDIGQVYVCWCASGADMREDCPIGFLLELENA